MEKEIKLYVPETLFDINLAAGIQIINLLEDKEIDDLQKAVKILATMSKVSEKDVSALPIDVISDNAAKIVNLFTADGRDYSLESLRLVNVEGVDYGLEPNFDSMETGAYIDSLEYVNAGSADLHKLMALLYRPIIRRSGTRYSIQSYVTENDEQRDLREDIFLRSMPYSVVRAVANFMLGALLN